MIKKIIGTIVAYIGLLIISQTITLGSYLFGKNIDGSNISKEIVFDYLYFFYKYIFDSKILYKGNYNKSNKVDILISNHINSYDFIIHIAILKLFDHRPIYFLFKKYMVFIPGIGFMFGSGKDIKMNRKFEFDIDNLTKKINEINEGIIFLAPEGTRYTPEKFIKAQQYSKDNNLPIFNNTLFPKMKGIFTILNLLKNNNRLGNIIDLTVEVENFKKKKVYTLDCVTKKYGTSYCIINSYKVPEIYLDSYDNFKKWFLNTIWITKDRLLENIQDKNINNYIEYSPKFPFSTFLISIICIITICYLIYHTKGIYILISLLVSYILMYNAYNQK